MKTKAQAIANPEPGDRWRMSYGKEYRITKVKRGYVYDECTKGMDAGQGEICNLINDWKNWAENSEYLGGAND